MKKFGAFALLLTLSMVAVGCEPTKPATKPTTPPAGGAPADKAPADKPADAAKPADAGK